MINYIKHWLHRKRYRLRYDMLQQLLHNQTLSQQQLQDTQGQDLANMVSFAAGNTEFYKNKYAGLLPDNINDLDITCVPILTKDEVIQQREAMLADGVDRNTIRLGYTGGSTGKPVSFYYDDHKMELMRAGMSRSYMWSGWRPGQKVMNFWGAKQDIKANTFAKRYENFITAEKTIGAYEYGETELNHWAQTIRTYRPVLIQGFASIIAELAKFIIDNRIAMPKTLRGVYSTAEVLYDRQRQDMQTAFGCKVYNQYGCREIPNIALECEQGNMHVFTDMVKLESVNTDNQDKLIITSLTNFLMPMIRYENGDTGKLKQGQCPCGSPFPMIEMGLCRSNDFIKTKHGKKIAPSWFIHLLDGTTGIRQYQFIQTELDKITLNINASSDLDGRLLNAIQQKIHNDIDPDMRLEITQTDEIQRTVSGKHRFVISNIS